MSTSPAPLASVNRPPLRSLPVPGQRWQHGYFSDFDEITAAIRDLHYDFVPLEPGPIEATATRLELDRIVLLYGAGTFPGHSMRARSERAALVLRAGPTDDCMWHGHRIEGSSLLSVSAGTEVVGRVRGRCAWIALLWDESTIDEAAAAIGHPTTPRPSGGVVNEPPGPAIECLRRAIAGAFQIGARNPLLLEDPLVRRPAEQAVLTAAVRVAHSRRDARSVRSVSHLRAVRAAFAVLEARASEPIYLAELCESAQVSERTLRNAFQHLYGVSPIRYLALRRMELVRRALRDADPRQTRVSDVASRFGFTNLGRFAMEFRQLYGESPSRMLRAV